MVLSDCKEVIPTDTVGTRIRDARKASGKTQKDFAAGLGMSENFIWQIEKGQREPSDRTISDICRVYGINEPWLREGVGEMYVPKTREETIAELVGSALNGSNDFKKAVIQMICSRTDQELETLEAALRAIYESL